MVVGNRVAPLNFHGQFAWGHSGPHLMGEEGAVLPISSFGKYMFSGRRSGGAARPQQQHFTGSIFVGFLEGQHLEIDPEIGATLVLSVDPLHGLLPDMYWGNLARVTTCQATVLRFGQ